MSLEGRVALVTGGAQGIGKTIALKLASDGADVALVDVDLESAEATAREVEALGRKAAAFKGDVTNIEEAKEIVKKVVEELGSLDILVNNAGITRDGLMLRMKEADWDLVMSVNLKGAFNYTQAAVKVMSKARYGRIINIASIVGLTGNVGQANYSASKAGLIGLTKTVAQEFAARNITSNAIAPGFIETAMTEALSEEVRTELASRIPMKRLGSVDDVASGVLFLSSEEASYITGHVLSINGGMYM
jgi:3-oxoacyl-[acyl-carrier protein] reductase